MKDALPKKIGLYKPTQFLGHGAMGNVYLCHDESLNRMVVVKQMVPSLYDQGSFVERFEREAKILAKLNHPVIVHPYALWQETNGQYSLAMEFVYGKSLRVLLDKCPKPPLWVVMEFLFQISSGLAEAHRYGVTHRDVKPANIMLDKDGRVRLLDFGVAHDERDQELTEDFAQLGTFIERADNTARILDVKYYVLLPSIHWVGSTLDNYQWESILRSVSAHRSYRWVYEADYRPTNIAEYLWFKVHGDTPLPARAKDDRTSS